MDTAGRLWSLLYVVIALLLGAGFVLGVTRGEESLLLYVPQGVGAVFFAASASSAVREHPASVPAQTGVLALLFGSQAAATGSTFAGALAVLMTVGTVVELYNWRTGSTLLRFD